jgi:sulfide:quinone oxidoreductase
VYAVGDLADFPLKQGGIATQQADVAAHRIAAAAGAPVEPKPFRPVLRGMLLTGSGAWWLRSQPAGGAGEGELAAHALWWPPSKIAGRWLSPYLSERDQEETAFTPPGTPLELRFGHGLVPASATASTVHPVEVLALEHPPPAGDQGAH